MAKITGHPNEKKITAESVQELAALGCSQPEIAAVLGCSVDTIQRRFAAEFWNGREHQKVRLRKMQFDAAKKGSVQMMIWLGKQILEQSERQIVEHTAPHEQALSSEEKNYIDVLATVEARKSIS